MKIHWKLAISALPIVAGFVPWRPVEGMASHFVLKATGIALALTWYSILDLQEKRREEFLPHTLDRLVRTTITAATLVLVFTFAWPDPARDDPIHDNGHGPEVPMETRVLTFFGQLDELNEPHEWTQPNLDQVIEDHFVKLTGSGTIKFQLGDGRRFDLIAGDVVRGRLIP